MLSESDSKEECQVWGPRLGSQRHKSPQTPSGRTKPRLADFQRWMDWQEEGKVIDVGGDPQIFWRGN